MKLFIHLSVMILLLWILPLPHLPHVHLGTLEEADTLHLTDNDQKQSTEPFLGFEQESTLLIILLFFTISSLLFREIRLICYLGPVFYQGNYLSKPSVIL